ncbi:MAG: hypothetical protein J4452_02025 [Candidatus Aenigmarchaeota archaeon]|nr:hypothetical protein [Candidatus Aenigmarchaeota archaeon]
MAVQTFIPVELSKYVRGRPIPEVQMLLAPINLPDLRYGLGSMYHPSVHSSFIAQIGADPTKHLFLVPTKTHYEAAIKEYEYSPFFQTVLKTHLTYFPDNVPSVKAHESFHVAECVLGNKDKALGEGLATAYGYKFLISQVLNEEIDREVGFSLLHADINFKKYVYHPLFEKIFSEVLGHNFDVTRESFVNQDRLKNLMEELEQKIQIGIEKIPEEAQPLC